jgi:hypothetical protein
MSDSTTGTSAGADHPKFPDVFQLRGHGFVLRSALNRYKAQLIAHAQGVRPVEPPPIDPDPLIPLRMVAAELGVGRRTIGRRIAESRARASA